MSDPAAQATESGHEHHGPSYYTIFFALAVLTALTVGVSYVDFVKLGVGQVGGVVVAMAIASVKATLVLLFFMHVKTELSSIWVVIGFPLVLCVILFFALVPDVVMQDVFATKYQIKQMIGYFIVLLIATPILLKVGARLLRSGV